MRLPILCRVGRRTLTQSILLGYVLDTLGIAAFAWAIHCQHLKLMLLFYFLCEILLRVPADGAAVVLPVTKC